jgi:hypothetical protein
MPPVFYVGQLLRTRTLPEGRLAADSPITSEITVEVMGLAATPEGHVEIRALGGIGSDCVWVTRESLYEEWRSDAPPEWAVTP